MQQETKSLHQCVHYWCLKDGLIVQIKLQVSRGHPVHDVCKEASVNSVGGGDGHLMLLFDIFMQVFIT